MLISSKEYNRFSPNFSKYATELISFVSMFEGNRDHTMLVKFNFQILW